MKAPIAETFHSIQGEGTWVGTPMYFVRLAGCSVGIRNPPLPIITDSAREEYRPYIGGRDGSPAWLCRAWDGRAFWCDTNFSKIADVTIEEILSNTWEKHICITGGEPLLHKSFIEELLLALDTRTMIHVETSGTIDFPKWPLIRHAQVWLTVSPKINYLPEMIASADELKLLVAEGMSTDFPSEFLRHENVYLSPINHASVFDHANPNILFAQQLLHEHPNWKLSVQLHKYLGVK